MRKEKEAGAVMGYMTFLILPSFCLFFLTSRLVTY